LLAPLSILTSILIIDNGIVSFISACYERNGFINGLEIINLVSKNDTEYITNNCPMNCKTIRDKSDLPHFRRISSDTWVILEKRSNQDIFVRCNSTLTVVSSSLNEAVTLTIKLPFGCQLLDRTKSFNSSHPCESTALVNTVIKPHFFKKIVTITSLK